MEQYQPNHESELLLAKARSLIEGEPNPITQALMAAAAIEEGMYIDSARTLGILGQISDEDDRSSTTVTPFQHKIHAANRLLEAYAEQDHYDDADKMLVFLESRDKHEYLKGVTKLLGYGYSGPQERYLQFSTEQLEALSSEQQPSNALQSEYARLSMKQFYVELYLCAVARYGVNILEPGTEYSQMLFTLGELGQLGNEEPWQTQRRFKCIGRDYAEGGHIELALSFKDMVKDHTLRAELCAEIAEATKDPAIIKAQVEEIAQLLEVVAQCSGECGHKFCDPRRDVRKIELHLAKILAKNGDSRQAEEIAGEPKFYFNYDQMTTHLEVYKHTGDETARTYTLSFFNELTGYRPKLLAGYLEDIAIADMQWGRTIPSTSDKTETIPLVCWQVRRIYSGLDKYAQDLLGDESGESPEFDPKISKSILEGRHEAIERLFGGSNDSEGEDREESYGPLSDTFNGDQTAIEADLKACQTHRDRAYAVLAALMAKSGAEQTAKHFLNFIDTPQEKVRGLVAVSRELSKA